MVGARGDSVCDAPDTHMTDFAGACIKSRCVAALHRAADAACGSAIELDVYDGTVRLRRADLLAALGRSSEALAAYDVAVEIGPMNMEVYLRKAFLLRTLGRHDEALCCYNRVNELEPGHTDALGGKDDVLARLGRDGKACNHHRQAHP